MLPSDPNTHTSIPAARVPRPSRICPELSRPCLSACPHSGSRGDRALGGRALQPLMGRAPGGGSGVALRSPRLQQQHSGPTAVCLRCGRALIMLSPAKPDRLLLINPFSVNAR